MRNRFIPVVFLSALVFAPPASALTGGVSNARIIVELKAVYEQLVEVVNHAQIQSDELKTLNTAYHDALTTYDTIQDLRTFNLADRLQRDFGNITQLHNMEGMSLEQRLRVIQREMDRRIAAAERDGDEEAAARYREQKRLSEMYETVADLEQRQYEILQEASGDIGMKDAARLQTQSAAISAASAAATERDRLRREIALLEGTASQQQIEDSHPEVMERLGRGW
ncbi:hypothetical protein CAI21_22550 [Alkalilimnicola ehrlichii]|uniref:Conjugal transfer protein TrbJ n=1 Tax=Alkalilimnicola ehrlichii TaxID=351052 RepID=A0A3E0WHN0_9GAMM|nr:hypothetical protein [Alkalilimnicola ehrlichii]RFA24176.1 hypothetical protein CAI21_22550 [Alkalilimnicola ehrlichii]RFA30843.1 hypothetical protein CAL65_22700 [Alkalilimnicola ehrlichii]